MHAGFTGAICRIGIFMVCTQAIVHFRPKASYEKYLRLLVGAMILAQFLEPLGALFGGGAGFAHRAGQMAEEMRQSMEKGSESAAQAQKLLEEMTLAQLRQRIGEEGAAGGAGDTGEWESPEGPVTIAPVEEILVGEKKP